MLGRRRKAQDPLGAIDPTALPPDLGGLVADALSARQRWQQTAATMAAGPLQERVAGLTDEVDAGVLAIWQTAQRLAELQRVAGTLDATRVTAEYKAAKRDPGADPQLVAALEAQHRSTHRLLNAVDDVARQVRLLDARLDAAVIRATELLLAPGAAADARGHEDLARVVDELQALHASLDELGR